MSARRSTSRAVGPKTGRTFLADVAGRPTSVIAVLVLMALVGLAIGFAVVLGLRPSDHNWVDPRGQATDLGVASGPCTVEAPDTPEEYTRAFASLWGGWAGGDQASSTLLPDGRTLWVFADTLQGTLSAAGSLVGARMAHNSFVLQDQGCFTPVNGPDGAEVVPGPGDGSWYWPQHAVVAGSTLWVTALRVTGRGWNALGFSLIGVDLAEFALPAGGLPRFVAMHPTPASSAGDFGVLWGTGVGQVRDTLYLYGTRRVEAPLIGKELLLARVPTALVALPSAWRYRSEHGWSADPGKAAVLRPAQGGVSTALSAHRTKAGWVLVTKRDGFLGDVVVALLAPDPWGPFRERELFASPTTGTSLQYLPMAHPQLPLEDGSLLVSVNYNDTSPAVVLRDPGAFRPRFTSVIGLG